MRFADHCLSAKFVRAVLDYDPDTGLMIWKSGQRAGRVAGWTDEYGYVRLKLNVHGKKRNFRVSRLAWLHYYGRHAVSIVDHRDLDRSNNAIENLREANCSQNAANSKLRAGSKSGHRGVCWRAREKKWSAQIRYSGVLRSLGYYENLEDACAAYAAKSVELNGEFSRLR